MHEFIAHPSATDWDDLRHYLEAARAGSFRAAALTLGTTQPTVGRRVDRLEKRLGTKLLRRIAHGVRMTPSGEAVFKVAGDIERLMRQLELQAAADRSLAGRIRLWVTDGIGGYWLPPRLVEFHRTHPEITIEVICSNEVPDLGKMEADIVVTYEQPINPNLVVLARASIDFRPFASREYLQLYGTPKNLADLQTHRICDHTEYPKTGEWQTWAEIVRDHPCVSYRTNSSITLGHKANIMLFSDGLFLRIFQEEAERNADVGSQEMQIDHLSMRLTRSPEDFDLLLLPNLYGDILSDLCAGLVGGLGLAPGANLGWEYAVFEPVHGSAPDIAGTGRANPLAMILSGAMLLRHLGEAAAARSVEEAVDRVLSEGIVRTPDLGGTASTNEVAAAVASALHREDGQE